MIPREEGPPLWLKAGLTAVLVVLLTVTGVVAGRKPAGATTVPALALSAALLTPVTSAAATAGAVPSPLSGKEPTGVPASAPAPDAPLPPVVVGLLPDGRVILNVASEEELRKLPRVGPGRAKAILALRAKLGKFRSVNDLLRVKGDREKNPRDPKTQASPRRLSGPFRRGGHGLARGAPNSAA